MLRGVDMLADAVQTTLGPKVSRARGIVVLCFALPCLAFAFGRPSLASWPGSPLVVQSCSRLPTWAALASRLTLRSLQTVP